MSQTELTVLPQLRDDIELLEGTPDGAGSAMWIIHDPLQHRYFQIDRATRDLIVCWQPGCSPADMADIVSNEAGLTVGEDQIVKLVEFVRLSYLTQEDQPGHWREISGREAASKQSVFWQFAHNYLFFKVPLLRPQRFLQRTHPYITPLYSSKTAKLLCVIGILALYLVSRQWDSFIGTFDQFFSIEGMILFGLSLFFLKAMHELGHAYTAVHFGCKVPVMGVAFMLLTPMLYTDVTDTWRLTSRRKRMIVSGAGILVELALAIIATIIWVLLPDGTGRSIAFIVATTGWIMSLAFNLNPCMKFDGYYLFSDLLGVNNLQSRAFALGRWKLRQVMLAPELAAPEQLSPRLHKTLIIYAWMTWLYRLVLYTTIALLVYHFAFKLLGIVLFALEIWLLIALPIVKELKQWSEFDRTTISRRRTVLNSALVFCFLLLISLPWSTRIEVPAVLMAADITQLYPARPAKVVKVNASRDNAVRQGAMLFQLQAPEIENQIVGTQIKLNQIVLRLGQVMADWTDVKEVLVLRQQLGSLQTKLDGLLEQRHELVIRAPVDGKVLQIGKNLHEGRWVGKNDLLALVASGKQLVIKGYVSESNLPRLTKGAIGQFIPDDLTRPPFSVKLFRMARAGSRSIDIPELASTNGGEIRVELDARKKLVPATAQYLVELTPMGLDDHPNQLVRGFVHLEGTAESFLTRVWRQISQVFIRESGF